MVKARNEIVTIRLTVEEKEAIEKMAESSDISTSDFIRKMIFVESLEMAKGLMYIFKFFEKFCKGANPDDDAKDKFYDYVDLGEKMLKLYKGQI